MNDLMEKKISRLKYHILPGRLPFGHSETTLYNKAYSFWKKFWKEVYESVGAGDSFKEDDFLRQDFIAVVTYNEEVVAMHLYTVFNTELQSAQDHRYFSFYPRSFFKYLEKNNSENVMSIEYLTVAEGWRKRDVGFSIGEALIGCSLNYLSHIGAQAVIAPARTDNKVHTMCYNFGFDCYKKNISKRNFNVDLVIGFKNKTMENKNHKINKFIYQMWKGREDHCGGSFSEQEYLLMEAS